MKLIHILGHNFNWNIDSYIDQNIGDEFLITAFSLGNTYSSNSRIKPILDKCMIDLQFYGKKAQLSKGSLTKFDFHPANCIGIDEPTNVYFESCINDAINYQIKQGFKKIIIPNYYEDTDLRKITSFIKYANSFLIENKIDGVEYFMSIPLAYDIVRNNDFVDQLLIDLTDMEIAFDGYFIACENKPEQGHKISVDLRLITNLSKIFKTLKAQNFKTIYAYANWDALIYLSQTDIDYITIGTFENLRNFSKKRYTEDISGGASKGYYFSEKLLNMVRAMDLLNIRDNNMLDSIRNDRNIFSDIILIPGYDWNIHKPDVNKNYLLSISKLLNSVAEIYPIQDRIMYVLSLIQGGIDKYKQLDRSYVTLQSEGKNYHLNIWFNYLLKTIQMSHDDFQSWYQSTSLE